MTITAWRVVKRKHATVAFDGAGARRHGGRWNGPGVAVIYTASSTSLGFLEMLVNASSSLLPFYLAIPVTFQETQVESIDRGALPDDWRTSPAPHELARIGNRWIASRGSPVLQVPSAVIPHEANYLLNPAHPEFASIQIGEPFEIETDPRLR